MTGKGQGPLWAVMNLPAYRETLNGVEAGPALYEGQDLFLKRSEVLAALAAATPADERAAMIAAVRRARQTWANDGDGESCPDQNIANALLAEGWTRSDAGLRKAARQLCDRLDEFSIRDGDFDGMVQDYLKNVADAHIALGAALARLSAPDLEGMTLPALERLLEYSDRPGPQRDAVVAEILKRKGRPDER